MCFIWISLSATFGVAFFGNVLNLCYRLGLVAYVFDSLLGEVEAGSSWISGQPGLYIRKLSQSNKPRNQTDCSFCFHSSTGVSYIVSLMVCVLCAMPMYYWVSVYIAYFKRFIIFISWIWMFCLPVYKCVYHVCAWCYGGPERMLNSLELEFYTVVSCCVGTGN